MKRFYACAALMLIASPLAADEVQKSQLKMSRAVICSPDAPASVIPIDKANRIVVYSASWCGPCQLLKPIVESLKSEGYTVVYRDIDRDADKLKYEYTAVPTIFFLRGEAIVKKETGYRSKEHIMKTLVRDPQASIAQR